MGDKGNWGRVGTEAVLVSLAKVVGQLRSQWTQSGRQSPCKTVRQVSKKGSTRIPFKPSEITRVWVLDNFSAVIFEVLARFCGWGFGGNQHSQGRFDSCIKCSASLDMLINEVHGCSGMWGFLDLFSGYQALGAKKMKLQTASFPESARQDMSKMICKTSFKTQRPDSQAQNNVSSVYSHAFSWVVRQVTYWAYHQICMAYAHKPGN